MAVLEKFTEMCDEFKLAHSKQISWQKTKRDNSVQLCDVLWFWDDTEIIFGERVIAEFTKHLSEQRWLHLWEQKSWM